jgi:hypothetical protein
MRIAIVSDIHANLPALEAVLRDLGNQHDIEAVAAAIRQSELPDNFATDLDTGGAPRES